MLTGKELGAAIKVAIDKKLALGLAKSKAEIARHFGVKPPSIHDWMKKGSIDKSKLPELWAYFSDVVSAEHWGLKELPAAAQATGTTEAHGDNAPTDPSATAWAAYTSASAATRAAIDLLLLPAAERGKLGPEAQAAIAFIEGQSVKAVSPQKSPTKAA